MNAGVPTWNDAKFEMSKPYTPLIKHGGFNPNPVAGNIPYFANSVANPDCVGSAIWTEWWDEQHDRCLNGYVTGNQYIPGRYYYYMNFNSLFGVMDSNNLPFYCDFDLEWYYTVEQIKKYHMKGMIGPKGRRKGLSEKACAVINHGLRYIHGYKAGVAAGRSDYLIGFRTKLEPNITTLKIPEMYLGTLVNDEKEIKIGYEIKMQNGEFTPDGHNGQVRFAVMNDSGTKLEGEYFHDMICEESGQFLRLKETINSVDPAMMMGAIRGGTFYVYGSAGNIMGGSKDFRELWYNAEAEGFVKMFVPGNRLYYPFIGGQGDNETVVNPLTGIELDPIKNLRHLEPYQRIGCEDIAQADIYIDNKTEHLRKQGNRRDLISHKKACPKTPEDAFESAGSNNFNNDKLYDQKNLIATIDKKFIPWILEFVMSDEADELGRKKMKYPLEVTMRPPVKGDKEHEYVYILKDGGMPIPEMDNLDIGGTDSYNQDKSNSSSSLGGIVVLRQGDRVPLTKGVLHGRRYPICYYNGRPPRKEQFFDIALKISVLYRLKSNMMLSAEYSLIIDHFMKYGGKRYVAPRPRSFDSPNSEADYKFGVKMNSFNKPLMVGLMQTDIEDNCDVNFSEPLVDNLIAYDELNIGDDWDLGDAYGYALMRCVDSRLSPRESKSDEKEIHYEDVYNQKTQTLERIETKARVLTAEDLFFLKMEGRL